MTDETAERWLPVPTWEPYYLAGDTGQVWSIRLGRPLKQAVKSQTKRHQVTLMVAPRRIDYLVSELICWTFHGERPEGLHCLHRDGDVSNNSAANLHWGTVSENIHDEVRHGTHRNSRKTHCPRQHPYIPGNIRWNPLPTGSISRNCISCGNARQKMKWHGWANTPELLKRLGDEYADRLIPGWRTWTPDEQEGNAA